MTGGIVFKRLREPVNGLTHLAAAAAALLGLALLLYLGRGNLVRQASLLLYGCSLILMFSASAAYHLISSGPRAASFLHQLDHASIYLLIAGTYTPICLYFFSGFWRWGILIVIWLMAVIGIIVKVFTINAPRWLSAGIYLLMGWLSIMGIRVILAAMPAWAIIWLALGGIFFSVGAVIYMTKKPDFFPGIFGFHELWHVFVILGCLSHFILIAAFVAPHAALT